MDDQSSSLVDTVLITGGSSGIGYELSRWFARDGYHILWAALEEQELQNSTHLLKQEFPETPVDCLAIDLSVSSAPEEVHRWAYSIVKQIDVLVNNAGFGTYGNFEQNSLEQDLKMIQVNATSLYELTHRFVVNMEQAGQGKIMNISSAASYLPLPYAGVYAATKAFVRQLSESIAWELQARNSKIQITIVCPAAIGNTNFQRSAGMDKVRTFSSPMASTSVEEVARDAYRGLKAGKLIVRTGWRFRINYWVSKVIPQSLTRRIMTWEMNRGRT